MLEQALSHLRPRPGRHWAVADKHGAKRAGPPERRPPSAGAGSAGRWCSHGPLPMAATQAVEWRSAAHDKTWRPRCSLCSAMPALAVRAVAPGSHARGQHQLAHRFAGVQFLPEDARLAKARWNAELVTRGQVVAGRRPPRAELTGPSPPPRRRRLVDVGSFFATPAGAGR